jgi:threonylcarbamoyladenosine tRNA methylthiotransferase MtaB
MRRKYDRTLFQNRVEHIKSVNPDCCIGVDVIVGFPGESDEDFRETMDFLQSLDVSYLHVFTYSERANTTAVKLGDPVPMHVRKDRSKQLGKHLTVLFEQEEDEGKMYGFTENYLKVERPFDASLVNQLVPVCVDQMTLDQTVKVTLDPL